MGSDKDKTKSDKIRWEVNMISWSPGGRSRSRKQELGRVSVQPSMTSQEIPTDPN